MLSSRDETITNLVVFYFDELEIHDYQYKVTWHFKQSFRVPLQAVSYSISLLDTPSNHPQ